jgi:alkylation response protein AidB-like acyl-CoA dehydrogenase
MKDMGLFGLTMSEQYGGLAESLLTYALVVEQIARGWMSVSGIINTHFIVAYMIAQYGTREAARVRRDRPGLTIPGQIDKMGKGVETIEMVLDGVQLPTDAVLGGSAGRGRGVYQMMDGIKVAGSTSRLARAACPSALFELAVAYAQQRRTFGKPIAEHQAIAFKLAEMATKVEAAHLLTINAAWLKDSSERNDVEAGMAKLLASEYCAEAPQEAFRIHGRYGYSKGYEIEWLMPEAPFLLTGEGTSEI